MTDRTPSLPFEAIARTVEESVPDLVAIRRDLHTHPELGRGEIRTTALIAERLERAGIGVRRLRGTGLVAEIGATDPVHRIALRADDLFGRVAAAGIACWFGFQAFQNIGMCLGIMPVTGVPLPLVSYGGSSMFASLIAIGLLQNIHMRSGEGIGVARSRTHRSRF